LTSPAKESVLEKSKPRTVAWYLIARKEKWLEIKVPYCASCTRVIERDFGMAIISIVIIGLPAAIGLWSLIGLDRDLGRLGELFELFLYGVCIELPIFMWLHFRNRCIALGSYNSNTVTMKFQNPDYFRAFQQLAFRDFRQRNSG
jgi:hypothetical protein